MMDLSPGNLSPAASLVQPVLVSNDYNFYSYHNSKSTSRFLYLSPDYLVNSNRHVLQVMCRSAYMIYSDLFFLLIDSMQL